MIKISNTEIQTMVGMAVQASTSIMQSNGADGPNRRPISNRQLGEPNLSLSPNASLARQFRRQGLAVAVDRVLRPVLLKLVDQTGHHSLQVIGIRIGQVG